MRDEPTYADHSTGYKLKSKRCESCVELLFVRGAGNCHECDTPLRKSNFRVQLFEDPAVDKEVEIRKKVLKIYNKREEDFPTLDEYNDFLEEIEEIVFNLTNNVDLENTKKKMELYQKDNKEVIQKNKLKLTREQEELEEALEVERQESEQRRLFIQKEEQLQQMIKRKNKQALLDDLESSDLPASLLLAQHKDRSTQLEMQLEKPKPVKPVTFSTGIKMFWKLKFWKFKNRLHFLQIYLSTGAVLGYILRETDVPLKVVLVALEELQRPSLLCLTGSLRLRNEGVGCAGGGRVGPAEYSSKGLDAKKNRFDLSARIYTTVKCTTAFAEVIVKGQHISLAPIQKLEETLYEYQPLQVETYGPQVPELEMLGRLGHLNEILDFLLNQHFVWVDKLKFLVL
ncbi:hypothetical protein BTVI_44210 [Pitangus sulphuratus]|nr:hypothetical protein BTVI_44210 [Pitangus sulphuratus]